MPVTASWSERFKQARERAGLSVNQAAERMCISAASLVQRIHDHCRSRRLTLEQFEDAVGWRLAGSIEPPEWLLQDMTIDGLQWLCRELGVDWQRVILGL